MRQIGWGLAAILVLACVSRSALAVPNWIADVPLGDCDGIPCVDATVGDGATGRYIIDTGNILSTVDNQDAKAIGFGPDNMNNGQIAKAAHPTVVIGPARMAGASFIPLALHDYVAKGVVPHARGSLAYPAFGDRIIQIDFVHHRFRMSDRATVSMPCTGHCAKLDLVKFGKEGPPILVAEGFSLAGKRLRAQIDSVYTGGLLVYAASIKALGLSVPPAAPKVAFPFTDDNVDMLRGRDIDLRFAGLPIRQVPLYFPTPKVHEPDGYFEATIGLAALSPSIMTMTIDLHDNWIELERPART